jgi:hypothetical protein
MLEDLWPLLEKFNVIGGDAALLAGIWGFFSREKIRRWLHRNSFMDVDAPLQSDVDWDVLIFTVSRAEVPIRVIEQLRPRHVGLVATESSRAAAAEIMEYARRNGMQAHPPQIIEDPSNPKEAKTKTAALIEHFKRMPGLHAESMAVDLTGGKVTMSLGAFMAAEEASLSTLYLCSPYDENLNKPDPTRSVIRCISKPE